MKVMYDHPVAETIYVLIEDGLCQSKVIPSVGGEDRDPWEDVDD